MQNHTFLYRELIYLNRQSQLMLITFDTAETVKMGDKTIEIVPAIDWLCQR